MATFVASTSRGPIMAMYIHEIVQMLALPHGAEQTAPSRRIHRPSVMTGQMRAQMGGHRDGPDSRARRRHAGCRRSCAD
jgi:hypothetical protein